MASFTAFLEVGGKSYPLFRYELSMHQETDTLGRPASPVLGGSISCTLSSPGSSDPFLYQWAMSPTMQQDGKIRLLQDTSKATEKTLSFFNAYCTGMDLSFVPGQSGGIGSNGMPSSLIQVRISPQRIAIGAILHDNNWPLESHGSGESFARQQAPQPAPPGNQEPSGFMEMVHTGLDVAGMIPVIGEVADAANAATYLAEGRHAEAALAAVAMIPLAGTAATMAKVANKAGDAIRNPLFSKLNTAFKKDWTAEKVVAIPKGNRPEPNEYLKDEFSSEHVDRFKEEGGGFIVVKSWTENGRFGQLPPRKFVGLNSEMDDVIREYNEKGKDWTVLRDRLNLGADTDLSAEEIYHVRIDKNDSRFRYEIPNGNEPGAISGEWQPGGFTKDGTQEAALIGSENCVHDKDINQLLEFFGKDKTTKIR